VRLIPPTIVPDEPSDGEKLVFELLAAASARESEVGAGRAGAAGRSGPDTSGCVFVNPIVDHRDTEKVDHPSSSWTVVL